MNGPTGKTIYVWQIGECAATPEALADQVEAAGFGEILVKVQQHENIYEPNRTLLARLVDAAHANGLRVHGWGYLLPRKALVKDLMLKSADRTLELCDYYRLDGYVVNAEGEWVGLKADGPKLASQYMVRVRAGLAVALGFTSYKYPSLHPIPWPEFLDPCDFYMQQVYWLGVHNPAAQLAWSLAEWNAYGARPSVPIGSCYPWNAWTPTVADVGAFHAAVDGRADEDCPGVSWWSWQHAARLPALAAQWAAIKAQKWTGHGTPAVSLAERVATLEEQVSMIRGHLVI